MIFITASGSRYEVNHISKQIRRLQGKADPTLRQGKDLEWKTYLDISDVVNDMPVIIVWSQEGDVFKTTRTNYVIAIEEDDGNETTNKGDQQ